MTGGFHDDDADPRSPVLKSDDVVELDVRSVCRVVSELPTGLLVWWDSQDGFICFSRCPVST